MTRKTETAGTCRPVHFSCHRVLCFIHFDQLIPQLTYNARGPRCGKGVETGGRSMISTPLARVALESLRGFLQLRLKSLHMPSQPCERCDRLSHCSSIFAAACVSLFLLAIFLRHQDQSEQRLVVNLAASSSTRKGLSSGYDSPPYSGETSSSGAPRFVPEWPDVFNPTP